MENKIYPRPHDKQTVYLKNVIGTQNIEVATTRSTMILFMTLAILKRIMYFITIRSTVTS